MSIHVALRHRTSYRYARPVHLGPQTVRLRPAPHCRTRILSYSLKVTPSEHFLNWQQDPQANYLARLVFPKPTSELTIEIDLVAEIAAMNPFDFFLEPSAEIYPFAYDTELLDELEPYRKALPSTPLFERLLASVSRAPMPTNDFLVALNQRLCNELEYRVRMEPGLQTPEQTLALRSGSCRDSGWLLVQLLRRLGFAARFVSGYLIQLVADTKPLEGPSGPTSDFVDLHAWCEVYLPGAGWIGLDPTSGLLAGEGHLPLACTADPSLAAPVSGLVDRVATEFEHAMSVERIFEVPRVTKPYTEAQWDRVVALGRVVDARLEDDDVRLTMGGEPTFISATDLDADEWNTAAVGPTKRALATDLFHRLRAHYAPNGLVHFGQGKWYPGEPLPRWALNLFWRRDGEPIWNDASLLGDEKKPSGATPADAARLLAAVATKVGIPSANVFPAFEDAYYYLWRERGMPINVDPLEGGKLDDKLERARLVRVFTTGLDTPVGHVLPIRRAEPVGGEKAGFRSTGWHFRGGHCWLVPGDSPLGLRLPLDAQPWVAPKDRAPSEALDPSAERPPLPKREELDEHANAEAMADHEPVAGESATWVVRTAMCAEPRNGVLCVFMPPLDHVEDYLALVAAVEAAAKETGHPVVLEGYTPPRDPRLVLLSVTPDPGVIEVNVQPARTWPELVANTTRLYELARESRLVAEKFELDGRLSGTGGGNHVVLGGATPDDSPFLRRPDLLRSFIGFFHQHPSLSFLFSGLFIGPTSQAPRLDEARNDSLFEMEIAFQEVGRRVKVGEEAPPWLVDRLFRDLLTDVTGNTHRSEICIDKLFSPDGSAGRLGLVELRALEMPPHARMSLAQQLLLRALVAWFWKTPFAPERLTRWGTELHDRFMLPYFVWQDFDEVLGELRTAGYAFESDWFRPHFEFRFPKVGDVVVRGVEIALRTALEPWNVMGEDAAPGGTARYVDSSLERLEVQVKGLVTPDRFALAVNGVELPIRPTGRHGEYVVGVRFRAWQPPRCLHPHIEVHAPLVFDLVDRWSERSLGGATYHVTHPGGRSHDTRPVNALEAEGRRRARFARAGHSQGKLELRRIPESTDFPFTLDLRRS